MKQAKHQTKLETLARRIRRDVLMSTTAAGSGHPSSCLSAVELVTALFFGGVFRADPKHPEYANNDRFVLSKGHAAPLLYAVYAAAGVILTKELSTLRKFRSRLEGHPSLRFPFTEVPTGSLGQGLSIGLGIAEAARLDGASYQTYVLLGDSELAEGSVWESVQLAAHRKRDNLTAIVDISRLGQSGPTMLGHNVRAHAARFWAFGWKPFIVDGHDCSAILKAYAEAQRTRGRPCVILAQTIKGKGVPFLENKNGWHGKALSKLELAKALQALGPIDEAHRNIRLPAKRVPRATKASRSTPKVRYSAKGRYAPRHAVGNALVRLAPAFPRMVVLDAEVQNSTYTDAFGKAFPQRFIQTYIAEQNMAGMANGLASRGYIPVAATFAAFLTRAFDQLRMAQYADTHQILIGTHVGVSIGQDGPSQMGLEDIAMFRTLQNSTVLCPADAWSAETLLETSLRARGIVYLRATRGELPILYRASEHFPLGGSKTLRRSAKDRLTIVGCGVTVHEALHAADVLAAQHIAARVIDAYSIVPLDAATLRRAVRDTRHVLVVEDHVAPGGLADAVRSALGIEAGGVTSLAVHKIPMSGTPEQLLAYEGIDAAAIVRAARRLLRR